MDESLFGFKKDVINECLIPVTLPENVPALPPEVQRLMACGCSAVEPCSKGTCSCKTLKLGCTEFCKCYGQCHNPYTSHITGEDYYNDIIDCAMMTLNSFLECTMFVRLIFENLVIFKCKLD